MSSYELEINKFRCFYKYSYDDEYFHFYWKKGKRVVEEKYPLNKLSNLLGYWKGYPKSTKKNILKAALLVLSSTLLFWWVGRYWILIVSLFLLVIALETLFNEIGFFVPSESTVLSYTNGEDCLYIQRDLTKENKRINFELGLIEAIENSKKNNQT